MACVGREFVQVDCIETKPEREFVGAYLNIIWITRLTYNTEIIRITAV